MGEDEEEGDNGLAQDKKDFCDRKWKSKQVIEGNEKSEERPRKKKFSIAKFNPAKYHPPIQKKKPKTKISVIGRDVSRNAQWKNNQR